MLIAKSSAAPALATPTASTLPDAIAMLREERRKTPDLPRPQFGRRKRDLPAR
jgi:hypothetical protein